MSDTKHHDIVEHNLAAFAKELEAKILDGWAISKTNPGDVVGLFGGTFTISLYRDNTTIQRVQTRTAGVQQAPKQDRATSLANARRAKAAKKVTNKS